MRFFKAQHQARLAYLSEKYPGIPFTMDDAGEGIGLYYSTFYTNRFDHLNATQSYIGTLICPFTIHAGFASETHSPIYLIDPTRSHPHDTEPLQNPLAEINDDRTIYPDGFPPIRIQNGRVYVDDPMEHTILLADHRIDPILFTHDLVEIRSTLIRMVTTC